MKLIALLTLALCACPSPPNPPPAPPTTTDAPWPGTCAAVCAHYAALGCPAGKPTAHGTPCEVVCANAQTVTHWDLACRSQAPSCEAADACERK